MTQDDQPWYPPQQPPPFPQQQQPVYGSPKDPAFYGHAPYGTPQGYGQRTNVLAIVSLVSGIISCGVGSLVAVVCGHLALNQIRRTGEGGRGMAVAGLVLGYLGLLALLVLIVVVLVAAAQSPSDPSFQYEP